MGRVEGKVAIVTGVASPGGLGFAIARALAREGAKIVVTDIKKELVRDRAGDLEASGARAIALQHDVAKEGDWQRVVGDAVAAFGVLDIVVNNAGVHAPRPVHEMTTGDWQNVLDINLMGTFLGCRYGVKSMRNQGRGGAIVNVGSISGPFLGFSGSAAYGASKGAVRSLTKTVALEVAREGIRCNTVHPGLIETDLLNMKRNFVSEDFNKLADSVPMGRIGIPDDIANAVLFLVSDEAKYVTGIEVIVDGGLVAQ